MYSDNNNRAFQSNRVFWVTDKLDSKTGWYFEAREGVFGPFPSQLKAETDMTLLIEGNPLRRVDVVSIQDSPTQDSWSSWLEPLHAAAV